MSFLRQHKVVVVITVIFVAVLALMYFVDPGTSRLAYKCPFKLLTGLDCPGCGGQRAVHAFLHGDFIAGLRYNPFLIVGLIYLALALIAQYIRRPWAEYVRRKFVTVRVAYIYIALMIVWWVGRNLI